MEEHLLKIIAEGPPSRITEEEVRKVKRVFRLFFRDVVLPHLSICHGDPDTQSLSLAEMAVEYFLKGEWRK